LSARIDPRCFSHVPTCKPGKVSAACVSPPWWTLEGAIPEPQRATPRVRRVTLKGEPANDVETGKAVV
jgi:hypothetical protein